MYARRVRVPGGSKFHLALGTIKRGFQNFGDQGAAATVEKEVIHLLKMDAIEPYNPKDLVKKDRHASLG